MWSSTKPDYKEQCGIMSKFLKHFALEANHYQTWGHLGGGGGRWIGVQISRFDQKLIFNYGCNPQFPRTRGSSKCSTLQILLFLDFRSWFLIAFARSDHGLHPSLFLCFVVRSFYRLLLVTVTSTCESWQLECIDSPTFKINFRWLWTY